MPAYPATDPPANSDAFTKAYLEHRAACQRHAQGIIRDRQLAEDVVQDVFTMLWQTHGHTYHPEQGPLRTWLKTIVHHKAVDAVRKAEARRRLQAQVASAIDPQPGDGEVHSTVWQALRAQELRHALTALSPPQRQVLTLAYQHGLTQTEISTRIGVPLGTVKSRTQAGLLRLRAALTTTSPHQDWQQDEPNSLDLAHTTCRSH